VHFTGVRTTRLEHFQMGNILLLSAECESYICLRSNLSIGLSCQLKAVLFCCWKIKNAPIWIGKAAKNSFHVPRGLYNFKSIFI
jgi:hypothetical protein